MHLYKRKKEGGKIWWYKFVIDGVAYQGSTLVRSRRVAEGIASAARIAVIEGKYGIQRQKDAPAFKDAMPRFLKHAAEQYAERTAARYEQSAKPLLKTFGRKKLHQITPDDVERFKNARQGSGDDMLAAATVNNDLAVLRSLFNYFIELKLVTTNPAAAVKFLPPDNEQMRVLTFDEERLYLAACEQPLYDIAVIMLDAGCRPEEVFRMKREYVNLAEGYLRIPFGKSKAAKRTLALTARVSDVLRGRLSGEGEYLFPRKSDPAQSMTTADYLHRKALTASGIDHCRLYDLRHTFGSRAAESGVDLATLKSLMGHSRIEMTLRYVHVGEEHRAQAIRKLEDFTTARQIEEATVSALVQ